MTPGKGTTRESGAIAQDSDQRTLDSPMSDIEAPTSRTYEDGAASPMSIHKHIQLNTVTLSGASGASMREEVKRQIFGGKKSGMLERIPDEEASEGELKGVSGESTQNLTAACYVL